MRGDKETTQGSTDGSKARKGGRFNLYHASGGGSHNESNLTRRNVDDLNQHLSSVRGGSETEK